MKQLAINGGTPVTTKPYPTWPIWGEKEEQNLLLDFDEKNLPAFAQRCEDARVIVYERLKQNGVKLYEYDSFEDFIRENGYDEV